MLIAVDLFLSYSESVSGKWLYPCALKSRFWSWISWTGRNRRRHVSVPEGLGIQFQILTLMLWHLAVPHFLPWPYVLHWLQRTREKNENEAFQLAVNLINPHGKHGVLLILPSVKTPKVLFYTLFTHIICMNKIWMNNNMLHYLVQKEHICIQSNTCN